jgi:Domain of unknown function (DUF4157)/Putative peptidoglycan binding domain/Lysine-specific metallo-endopeptidase
MSGRAHSQKSHEVNSILQRTIGNQAVQRFLRAHAEFEAGLTTTISTYVGQDASPISVHAPTAGPIQTKLAINKPRDEYEQEADRTAGGECEGCSQKKLQRRAAGRAEVAEVPDIVHEVLRSPGQPLDAETRAFFEPRFGPNFGTIPVHALARQRSGEALTIGAANDPYEKEADRTAERVMGSEPKDLQPRPAVDFSLVRMHTDAKAAESARDVGALAYTVGSDLVFGAGQYKPNSVAGRNLLGHELAHTLQQGGVGFKPALQRVCDPASLVSRTKPVFFPNQASIKQVFDGAATLGVGTTRFAAVALVQQALVDLGFDLGTTGRNGDGVDRDYGTLTKQAVTDFQTSEAIAGVTPGVVDQATLKCLDEVRSHETVPNRQIGTIPEEQFQVGGENTSSGTNIFFERGSATLNPFDDEATIKALAAAHKGCGLELQGFISEDERIDFGDQLATDRLIAVDDQFRNEGHDAAGVCTPPMPPILPLRTLTPKPEASAGLPAYRDRRKVEVIPPGAAATTLDCETTPDHRALDATETVLFNTAVADSLPLMNMAIGHLVVGDVDGDAALTKLFDGVSHRTTVKGKLQTWRDHIDRVVRTRKRRGTGCDSLCEASIAYNLKTGPSAMMTLCDSFFGSIGLYPLLNDDQRRAVVLIHEAGHGSLDTDDIAYNTGRLVNFISRTPALALKNTDSFVTLVQCLAGLPGGCDLPVRSDTVVGIADPLELDKAQEGLAWLNTWLIWAEQDVGGLFGAMARARPRGRWAAKDAYYSEFVLPLLADAFELDRPDFNALPTFREQTEVAAIWDRFRQLSAVTDSDLHIEKDTSVPPSQRWEPGATGPSNRVFLTDAYFPLTPRERVEVLLSMIVEGTPMIDVGLRTAYVNFTETTVRDNWDNEP